MSLLLGTNNIVSTRKHVRKLWTKHSTLFLIGHFFFAFFLDVYKTNFVEMFEVFYTYFRIEIRLASLPSRSVVPLYRY